MRAFAANLRLQQLKCLGLYDMLAFMPRKLWQARIVNKYLLMFACGCACFKGAFLRPPLALLLLRGLTCAIYLFAMNNRLVSRRVSV